MVRFKSPFRGFRGKERFTITVMVVANSNHGGIAMAGVCSCHRLLLPPFGCGTYLLYDYLKIKYGSIFSHQVESGGYTFLKSDAFKKGP